MLHVPNCSCVPCRENPTGTRFKILASNEWHEVGP
jgi:hypothetical protein